MGNLPYMSLRSVGRYTEKYFTAGTVEPASQRHGPTPLLSDFEELTMLQLLLDNPNMYLYEIQRELYDFTGTVVHVSTRVYGYSLCELTPITHKLKVWRKIIAAIGIMSMCGIEDVYIYEGNANGEVFEHFVRTTLLPLLMPYNGTNTHSVVVMDTIAQT